jgi:SPP1 gp7 family putative phage head morphogenesis protein
MSFSLDADESRGVVVSNHKNSPLSREIAVRTRSADFFGFNAILPDPDPVLRKTGQDAKVYRELLADAHVASCYESRKSGVLSRQWILTEAAEGDPDQNSAARDLCLSALKKLDVRQIVSDMLDAPFFGFSPIEIIWGRDGGKWLPVKVVGRPMEWFRFDPDGEARFLSKADPINGEKLPGKKFILARHHATYLNPYGDRALSRCFWPVVFKRGGWEFWTVFAEKYGIPWVIGKVPRGTNETERDALLASLSAMVQDAAAVINDDENIDIKEPAGRAASADVFAGLIREANAEVSKAVLGQTLTTEMGETGSYAAAGVHNDVRWDLIDSDAEMVAAAFNQLCRWIVEFNLFGANPPEFGFAQEEQIQKDRAERDEILARAMNGAGLTLSAEYFKRVYNLEDGDITTAQLNSFPWAGQTSHPSPVAVGSPGPGTAPIVQAPADFSAAVIDQNAVRRLEAVEALTIAKIREAVGAAADWGRIVRDFVGSAPSLEAARDRLFGLFDRLPADQFQRVISAGLYQADKMGRRDAAPGANFAGPVGVGWGEAALPFEDALEAFQNQAFWVSGIARADLLLAIQADLENAIKNGWTMGQTQAAILETAATFGAIGLTAHHIETIVRTNLASAYNAGRYRQMTEPGSKAVLPFWRYVAVMDSATRPSHAAMHGKVYPADDPVWKIWFPPNGYNCRCDVTPLSQADMDRFGFSVSSGRPGVRPDAGFAHNPALEPWRPDLSDYPADLAQKIAIWD